MGARLQTDISHSCRVSRAAFLLVDVCVPRSGGVHTSRKWMYHDFGAHLIGNVSFLSVLNVICDTQFCQYVCARFRRELDALDPRDLGLLCLYRSHTPSSNVSIINVDYNVNSPLIPDDVDHWFRCDSSKRMSLSRVNGRKSVIFSLR